MALLTLDVITQESLAILHNQLSFTSKLNHDYDSEFGKSGAKAGSTVRVRKPVQYSVRTTLARSVQTVAETYVNVTLDQILGVDFNFTDVEMETTIDDFARRYIKTAVVKLASEMEKYGLSKLVPAVNSFVGTFNTAITKDAVLDAGVRLTEQLAPETDRCLLVTPKANGILVSGFSGVFNSASAIGEQFRTGVMDHVYGFDFIVSNLIPVQETGTFAGTILSNGATQSGSSIAIDGFTAATGTIKKGTIVTFAGTNAVNLETKGNLGYLSQHTVTADATIAGNAATIIVSPALVATGVTQNVSSTIADGSAVTWVNVGTTVGNTYKECLAFHPDFATFVMAELELPKAVEDSSYQSTDDGFKIRVVRFWDGTNGVMCSRLDAFFGYDILYPEWAVRIGST